MLLGLPGFKVYALIEGHSVFWVSPIPNLNPEPETLTNKPSPKLLLLIDLVGKVIFWVGKVPSEVGKVVNLEGKVALTLPTTLPTK